MMRRSRLFRWAALALVWAHPALATPVTVTVKTAGGAAAADTLVIVDSLDATPSAGHASAIIDQINKKFVPRVSIVRTGTAVTFPNSDNIRHQVYSFSDAKQFNLKLYAGSPKQEVVFDKPGLVVLGCNIHDTMIAFLGIVDTPYFGKVSDAGSVSLDLPAGRYKIRIWNPALASAAPAPEIEVGASPLALPLTVTLDPRRDTVADWPK
jgi:plastocyanin